MADTMIVGILNITPDSFSDGGTYLTAEKAMAGMEKMIQEGADVIDIGAESTRPGATPLTAAQEWERLEPVLALLPRYRCVVFSLDTRHAGNAQKSLQYGVGWLNDVSGFTDPAMVKVAAASSCKLVVMHSLSVPADKGVVLPEGSDVIRILVDFAQARIRELEANGVHRQRIIFDPGIGFGKTAAQSQDIIDGVERFAALGVPLMIGHSRKSFLASMAGMDRDAATLQVSGRLIKAGVAYLRVHDVAAHVALRQRMVSPHDA